MFRILMLVIVAGGLGCGLGFAQQVLASRSVEERFVLSRESQDEIKGKTTRDEILSNANAAPKVEVVGGPDHYFGMMQHGETMSHEFKLRNVGEGPLTLDLGKSSCTCTVGELDSSTIQPGEETSVKLTWTAKTILPDFGQYAMVVTNDTENQEIKLTVRGQIATSFMLEPNSLQLGTLDSETAVDREFFVFSYLDNASDLADVSWSNPSLADQFEFEVSKEELDAGKFPQHVNAKHMHRVRLNVKPGLPIGPVRGAVKIQTSLGQEAGLLSLPVSASVAGNLELRGGPSFDPRSNLVDLGNIDSKDGASVSVLLFLRGEDRKQTKLEVVSVKPEDALQVEIGEPKDSSSRRTYSIKFVVPKGAPKTFYPATEASRAGEVVLRAVGERTEELPIRVRLIVRD